MAQAIKIALVADASAVNKGVAEASRSLSDGAERMGKSASRMGEHTSRSLGEVSEGFTSLPGKFGKVQEGFDNVDTAAMGFRDTMTGVQDTMRGVDILTGKGQKAYDAYKRQVKEATAAHEALKKKSGASSAEIAASEKNLARMNAKLSDMEQSTGSAFDGFLTLGFGIGDMASGIVNLFLPAAAMLGPAITGVKTAMAGLNLTFLASPITWIVIGVVALVAALVIAYQKSETFRRIVNGAFTGVWNAIKTGWNWVKGNWPLLLAIITGPIGLATRFVVQHWSQIVSGVKSIPGKIRGAFSSAGDWLKSAGSNIVRGIWSGISSMSTWLYNTLISWARRIIPGPIAKALGIASPSKVMRRMFQWVPKGAALGIGDGAKTVRSAAVNMASEAAIAPASPVGTSGSSRPVSGSLELRAGSGSTSAAGQLIVALLREEIRKGGGLKAVLGS